MRRTNEQEKKQKKEQEEKQKKEMLEQELRKRREAGNVPRGKKNTIASSSWSAWFKLLTL